MAAKVKSFFRNEEVFLLFQGGGIKKCEQVFSIFATFFY